MRKLRNVVTLLVMVLTLACAFTACAPSNPQSGAEAGTYYCEVEDAEYLLTLGDGNTAKLVMEQEQSGTYTIENGRITLKFGDTTMTATLGGDILTLTVSADKTLTFYRDKNFTVTFDYRNGADNENKTVRNGKTVEKPQDPTRDGYDFGGWYVGENAYDFTTAVTADITLTAHWTENPKLASPTITLFNENRVMWSAVNRADAYSFELVGPEDFTTVTEELNTTSKELEITIPGTYTVTITAISKSNPEYNSEPAVQELNFRVLDKVTGITVGEDLHTLNWDTVEHADGYKITVVCGNADHTVEDLDLGTATSYDFSACTMREEGVAFTITAYAADYGSSSVNYTYDRRLAAATGFTVNAETETVSWTAVPNATAYSVTVGSKAAVTVTNTSVYVGDFGKGNLVIKVLPKAANFNSPKNPASYTYNKATLVVPQNVHLDGNRIYWDVVEDAAGYTVKYGATEVYVDGGEHNYFNLQSVAIDGSVAFSVMAKGADTAQNTIYSEAITVNGADAFEGELHYNNGVVSWNFVLGAAGYTVTVNDGDPVEVSSTTNKATVKLTKKGVNTIKVAVKRGTGAADLSKTVDVTAYQVTLDKNGDGAAAVGPYFVAEGDELPVNETTIWVGYQFAGWFTNASAEENDRVLAGTTLTKAEDITLYAGWFAGGKVVLNFGEHGTAPDSLKNNDNEFYVSKDKNYQIPVPVISDSSWLFAGYFSGENAQGTRYTDEQGKSITPWNDNYNVQLYAYYVQLKFEYLPNSDTYSLVDGNYTSFDKALFSVVRIPAKYNDGTHGEKFVSTIDSYALMQWKEMTKVYIPQSVTVIEDSAFYSSNKLDWIQMYDVNDFLDDIVYESFEGVLVLNNPRTGEKEIKMVPVAKSGTLDLRKATFTNIPSKAFHLSSFKKIILPASVKTVQANAFYYNEQLETVEFGESTSISIAEEAFSGCIKLKNVKLPANMDNFTPLIFDKNTKSLEEISVTSESGAKYSVINGMLVRNSDRTLLFCPHLKQNVTIPSGTVVAIGDYAFRNATALTSITIPNWIDSLGEGAFYGCISLKSVTFTGGASQSLEIPDKAFYNCYEMTQLSLGSASSPLTVTKIGSQAFYNCFGLTSFTVSDSVTEIGEYAFERCRGLTSVDLGSGVTKIGAHAFSSCTKLSEISIPASVTMISSSAFENCSSLSSVQFAQNGTELAILEYAFVNCTALKSFEVPKHANSIIGSMFMGCSALTNVTVNSGNTDFVAVDSVIYNLNEDGKYVGIVYYPSTKSGDVSIPSEMTEIGSGVFAGNTYITSIVIPATVTVIGDNAFTNCSNLRSVEFEAKTQTANSNIIIGKGAFSGCTKLNSVTLSDRVTAIADEMFKDCTDLAVIDVSGVSSIGDKAFYGCTGLLEVTMKPATGEAKLTSIGHSAFYNCTALSELTVPNSVLTVKIAAFSYMKALNTVVFEDGTNPLTLENSGAYDRNNQTNSYGIFHYDSALKNVTLNRITRVPKNCFASCSSLETITLPKGLKDSSDSEDGYAIGYGAFQNAGLTNVTFGDVVDDSNVSGTFSIGQYAFGYCKFTSIDLPKHLVKFDCNGQYSIPFGGMTTLATINFVGNDTYTMFSGVLYNAAKTEIVYVPVALSGKVVIPATLQEIPILKFTNTKITELAFEEDEEGFTGDKNALPALTIANGSSTQGAFYNCTELNSVSFPARLQSIGNYAFRGCTSLENVEFKEGRLESIGTNAFENTSGLESIVIPNQNITLAADVFLQSAMDSITMPAAWLTKISTFGCSPSTVKVYNAQGVAQAPEAAVTYENVDGGRKLVSYSLLLKDTSFEVPADVVEIADSAFYGNPYIETITFAANSLTTKIGANAFASCANLNSVAVGGKVTDIGASAFENCTKLTSVTFPDDSNLQSVSDKMFRYTGLTTFVVPAKVTTIGTAAFEYCKELESITFKKQRVTEGDKVSEVYNIATIGNAAFQNTGLKSFVFPESVTKVALSTTSGNRLFTGCSALTSIKFLPGSEPEKNPVTLNSAFYGLSALTSVDFGGRLQVAPDSLLHNDSKLTELKGLENLKTASTNMFNGCSSLTTIHIPDGVTKFYGQMFYNCTSLTSVTGMKNITSLDYVDYSSWGLGLSYKTGMFRGCTSLKSITLPSGLKQIAAQMFYGSGIEEIVIPASVEKFTVEGTYPNTDAFQNCASLKKIRFEYSSEALVANLRLVGCTLLTEIDFGGREVKMFAESGNTSSTACAFDGLTQDITFKNAENVIFGPSVFKKYAGLTEVTVDASITSTFKNMYEGCNGLKKITFAQSKDDLTIVADSFANLPALEEVDFAGRNVVIKDGAFAGCAKLATLKNTDGITEIGNSAFSGTALTSFDLPENLTSIGNDAFLNCSKLASVTFGSNIASIGDSAFRGTAIESLTLPITVSEFGDYIFADNKALSSLNISSDAFASIGNYTFSGCTSLTSVTFTGEGRTFDEIGAGVFQNTGLTGIAIPEKVRSIGDNAFEGTKLTSVEFPANLMSLGDKAFANCENLNNVNITASVSSIEGNPFSGCTALTTLTIDQNNSSYVLNNNIVYTADESEIVFTVGQLSGAFASDNLTAIGLGAFDSSAITSATIGGEITTIANHTFANCTQLTSVSLPDGLLSIGDYAFAGSNISSIVIPDSVRSIGAHAFDGCANLSSVTLPASLLTLGEGVFKDCVKLTSVTIPASLYAISASAFDGCEKLTTVNFATGSKLDEIGSYAFRGTDIQSLTLPATVINVKNHALSEMKSLTTVTFSAGKVPVRINNVDPNSYSSDYDEEVDSAFVGSDNLTTVNFNGRPTYIGFHAFEGLTKLNNIDFSVVRDIFPSAFEGCTGLTTASIKAGTPIRLRAFANSGLKSLTLPEGITTIIDEAFLGTKITSVTIPSTAAYNLGDELFKDCTELVTATINVTITSGSSFGRGWFDGCTSLASVTFTDSTSYIKTNMFKDCTSLTSLKLPSNITYIGENAFEGCSGFTSFELPATVTTVYPEAFKGWTAEQTIYVVGFTEKPSSWALSWCGEATVEWGKEMPKD